MKEREREREQHGRKLEQEREGRTNREEIDTESEANNGWLCIMRRAMNLECVYEKNECVRVESVRSDENLAMNDRLRDSRCLLSTNDRTNERTNERTIESACVCACVQMKEQEYTRDEKNLASSSDRVRNL